MTASVKTDETTVLQEGFNFEDWWQLEPQVPVKNWLHISWPLQAVLPVGPVEV